jgi:ATP/ADP translocase
LAVHLGSKGFYPVLWLGKEILNTFIGLLVWGLANLACDARQAKRLFPLFNASRILGSVAGGFATGVLAARIGTESLLMIWSAAMLATFIFSGMLVRSHRTAGLSGRPPRRKRVSLIGELQRGYRQVIGSDLLRWIAIAMVFFSVLYFSISMPFSRGAAGRYPDENQLAAFLGLFNGLSTAGAFLVSLFLANRLFTRIGIMNSLLLFTLIYLAGFSGLMAAPVFAFIAAFRFIQMLSLSGIADPAYQAMFNILPAERRDQARAFIDGLPSQAGTMLAGLILIVGERALEPRQLYLIGAGAAGICTLAIWRAGQGYRSELIEALRSGRRTFLPGGRGWSDGVPQDAVTIEAARKGLGHQDPDIRFICVEILGGFGITDHDRSQAPP